MLINLENISLAFGLEPLLDHIQLQISKGERVCLIGRNGAGKSSLLKIVEGSLLPDSGSVWRKPHLRLARLTQELPRHDYITVYEFVAKGLAEIGELLSNYHQITHELENHHAPHLLTQLEKIQNQIDAKNGWQFAQQIKTILTRLSLNGDQRLNELSGGWQRRAALAQALVTFPELLLLDEPTNHLDIEAIQWLEDELLSCGCAILFITHDRALLQRLATRIIELDRGVLTSWNCNYQQFLTHKEEWLHAEAKQQAEFDKKLAQEERWIRQGIKARRTRNEGRVRALKAMRFERAKRREVQGKTQFSLNEAEKSGQLVIEAKHISHRFDDRLLINDFSIRLMRGDHIGLIGPNGIGKSTLLNILLGHLKPQQGTISHGTKLQIAYFDQQRNALDLDKTVIDNVVTGSDMIEVNGKKQHIISYLADFLFTPERALTPVKALSGGECNRLLLARLFSQPANLLVMDEPTNDLDIETLELLEELLNQFAGTLLIVSHDRAFLDNVVTSTLIFAGNGVVQEYIGGYEDYLSQRKVNIEKPVPIHKIEEKVDKRQTREIKKLSYKEQKELDELPKKIEELEKEQSELQLWVSNPEFYKQNAELITQTMQKLKKLEKELERAYQRWDELETFARNIHRS